jgi:phosphatidylserine decarboxylase
MLDQAFLSLMRLLPKSALSTAVGAATRAPVPAAVHQLAIQAFAAAFRISVEEAEQGLGKYPTFGEFFTRKLKPGVRPIDPDERVVVSPVDAKVSQAGVAEQGRCVQAKGISYSISELLQDPAEAAAFEGGSYATLYLSPRDYHRIHAPLSGKIEGYRYLPGAFWPVSPRSVRAQKALFCLNERLVTYLSTSAGKLAVVAVGATCVARIRASYDSVVTHSGGQAEALQYAAPIAVNKGDELGVFEMGSTVILLSQPGRLTWDASLAAGATVQVGRRIGALT